MPRRLLLLDLDDTLLYQERVNRSILQKIGSELLPPQRVEDLVNTFCTHARLIWEDLPLYAWTKKIGISWGEGLWGNFVGADPNLKNLAQLAKNYRVLVWQETLESLGVTISIRQAEALAQQFKKTRENTMVLVEGALDLLAWLRPRFHLGLLTNGAPDLQRFKIERSGLARWFDHITISGDYGFGKPSPEIFVQARRSFGLELPCLMIGNSPSSDIQGAFNANIPSIWFDIQETNLPSHLQPVAVVTSLTEIPKVLHEIQWVEDA
jgi:putative hydrolase of the HAD superfamily